MEEIGPVLRIKKEGTGVESTDFGWGMLDRAYGASVGAAVPSMVGGQQRGLNISAF